MVLQAFAISSAFSSQLATTGTFYRGVKTGETDSPIREAFFQCDRNQSCMNVFKSKTKDAVDFSSGEMSQDQIKEQEFVYTKQNESKQIFISLLSSVVLFCSRFSLMVLVSMFLSSSTLR